MKWSKMIINELKAAWCESFEKIMDFRYMKNLIIGTRTDNIWIYTNTPDNRARFFTWRKGQTISYLYRYKSQYNRSENTVINCYYSRV